MRDLPQRAGLHGLQQFREHVAARSRHFLQLAQRFRGLARMTRLEGTHRIHLRLLLRIYRLLLSLLPLALAACALAPPEKDVPQAAADKDTICERESRSGTNFP